eukprot:COSAG01_NODE_19324_length_1015_cov_1.782135_1_plen_97_part_00
MQLPRHGDSISILACVDGRGRPPAQAQAHDAPPGPEPARGGGDDDAGAQLEAEAGEPELEALVQEIGAQGGAPPPPSPGCVLGWGLPPQRLRLSRS